MKLSAKIIGLALMTSFVAGHAFAAEQSTQAAEKKKDEKKKDEKKEDEKKKDDKKKK